MIWFVGYTILVVASTLAIFKWMPYEFSECEKAGGRYARVKQPETNQMIISKIDEINWGGPIDGGVCSFMVWYPLYMFWLLIKSVRFLITASYVKTMKTKHQLEDELIVLNAEVEKAKLELQSYTSNVGEYEEPTKCLTVTQIELTDKQKVNLNVGNANLNNVR